MRRSASQIINELEGRIARLEGKTAKSTPITLESQESQMQGTTKKRTVNGLKAMLKEVQEMYNKGTYIEDPKDRFEEINVPWDYKGWIDLGDTIMFQVDHEINYDENIYLEVSKAELCQAMSEEGLLDQVIDKFLKKSLRT